ncbi:hypothetical protein MalM25_35050 [Planctomycetes bacterium MalM25]|nr:hypothetical protein MalM25_35050 [Planctomycetes bacterium MalM25]
MAEPSLCCLAGTELCEGLEALIKARRFAHQTRRDPWDFALMHQELATRGVGPTELRWMLSQGWVLHGSDQTRTTDSARSVERCGRYVFDAESCFVLTEEGQRAFEAALGLPPHAESRAEATPQWDGQRHELLLSGVVIKRYRWPALNQEAILAAFEEEGWAPRIDDPLTPMGDTDPKRRLADTIKCLNRNQQRTRIRFRGDGTGEGVIWGLV